MSETPAPRTPGVEASAAWRQSMSNEYAVWTDPRERSGASVRERLHRGLVEPRTRPKFQIAADDVFFCIGSCFARELEESLVVHGLRVESVGLNLDLDRAKHRRTGFVNKFTTPSMLNEIVWAFGVRPFPENALVTSAEGTYDLQLRPNITPGDDAKIRARRAAIIEYFQRLRHATVVVLTLGLNEVWFDREAGIYLNGMPPQTLARQYPGRFTVHARTHAETLGDLEACRRLLVQCAAPGVRLVVTVSPIPFQRTFLGDDAMTANGYGKATLRSAAGEFAAAHADVEYFGSYEMITVSERGLAFRKDDELHVYAEAALAVTTTFLREFGLPIAIDHPDFHEFTYLRTNPDVEAAVLRGDFASGYEHWLRHGRAEGRSTVSGHLESPGHRT